LPTPPCADQGNEPMGRYEIGHLGELDLPADQLGYRLGKIGQRAWRIDTRGRRRRRPAIAGTGGARADLAAELVAPPGDRADQPAVGCKDFAQRSDLARQPVLVDNPALPDAAQELVLADDRPRRLDQRHQHIESPSAKPYRPAVGEQLAAMRQDTEVAKFDDRRRVGKANHGRRL
jgi:hypothetical protein